MTALNPGGLFVCQRTVRVSEFRIETFEREITVRQGQLRISDCNQKNNDNARSLNGSQCKGERERTRLFL
jgi:hypothetical protein